MNDFSWIGDITPYVIEDYSGPTTGYRSTSWDQYWASRGSAAPTLTRNEDGTFSTVLSAGVKADDGNHYNTIGQYDSTGKLLGTSQQMVDVGTNWIDHMGNAVEAVTPAILGAMFAGAAGTAIGGGGAATGLNTGFATEADLLSGAATGTSGSIGGVSAEGLAAADAAGGMDPNASWAQPGNYDPNTGIPYTSRAPQSSDAGWSGDTNVDAGSNTPMTGAPTPPIPADGGTGPTVTPPATTPSTGSTPVPTPSTRDGLRSALESVGLGDLFNILSGLYQSIGQGQTAEEYQNFLNGVARPQSQWSFDKIKQSYDDPASYLNGPEFQAILDTTHNQLQRKDAAGGGLGNDWNRQLGLQRQAMTSLNQYRTPLATMATDFARTNAGLAGQFGQASALGNTQYAPLLRTLGSIFGSDS